MCIKKNVFNKQTMQTILILMFIILLLRNTPRKIRERPVFTPPALRNGLTESTEIVAKRSV